MGETVGKLEEMRFNSQPPQL